MKRSGMITSCAALLLSVLAIYVVLSNSATAQGDANGPMRAGLQPLKVAVVDYEALFRDAKVRRDREAEATRIISELYEKPAKEAQEELTKKDQQLRESQAKTVGRDVNNEAEIENQISVLQKKLKMYEKEIKTARTMLMTKFRAQAMMGILLEVKGHAERNGIDLVFNRANLTSKKEEEGVEEDEAARLNFQQKFSADLTNSALLYFSGKDEFAPKKAYTVIDLTAAVSDTLKVKGWAEMADQVDKALK